MNSKAQAHRNVMIGLVATALLFGITASIPFVQEHMNRSVYTVRVLDLNQSGERKAIVVIDDEPFLFQYGNKSYGTSEFCLLDKKPTSPDTCFRTSSKFDPGTTNSQRLKLMATWVR